MTRLEATATRFHEALAVMVTGDGTLRDRLAGAVGSGLSTPGPDDGTIPTDTLERVGALEERLGSAGRGERGVELELAMLDDADLRSLAEYVLDVALEVESEYRRAAGAGEL